MRYKVIIQNQADSDIRRIIKSASKSEKIKLAKMLDELELHPTTGTGKPEQLRYELSGCWSRRINRKDRLIYEVNEEEATVTVLSALGHY
jgi:toxin YoeB